MSSVLYTIIGASIVAGQGADPAIVSPKWPRGAPLALLNATPWIGIAVGLSVGGVAIIAMQIRPALLLAVVPAVGAILLLTGIKEQ